MSSDLLNLTIIFPKNGYTKRGFKLCSDKPYYKDNIPYLVIYYNKYTKELEHHDTILLPVTMKMAIKMFKERY
jgi:hypothetical protein